MEPMKPMAPMEPMEPMKGIEPWWPETLGRPSSSGSQDGFRYAFFSEVRRLLIEENGKRSTYDTGNRRITGVSQSGRDRPTVFDGPEGTVRLDDLRLEA